MNKKDILELLATKEVIIVLVVLGVVVLIYAFLWFMEFLQKQDEKKKLQNNTMELKKLVSEIKEIEEKEKATKKSDVVVKEENKTPVLEEKIELEVPKEEVKEEKIEKIEENPKNIDSIMLNNQEEKVEISMDNKTIPVDAPKNEEEVIKYKDEVYTKTEAQQELERLTHELQKIEEEKDEENIELTKFEEEQEENAIISLDELLEKGKSETLQDEIEKYEDEGNEPISISELEERYNSIKEDKNDEDIEILEEEVPSKGEKETVSLDDFFSANTHKVYSENHGYKPSPIISPIYGIEEDKTSVSTLELENTATYPKMDEELKKTNEFLAKLRELQKKLN